MERNYRDRCYEFFVKMERGVPVRFDKVAKKQTREQFIEIVKDFIRYKDYQVMGFELEISSDYKSFRKL